MVYFNLIEMDAQDLVDKLKERGLLVLAVDRRKIRAVPNLMVNRQDIETALGLLGEMMQSDG